MCCPDAAQGRAQAVQTNIEKAQAHAQTAEACKIRQQNSSSTGCLPPVKPVPVQQELRLPSTQFGWLSSTRIIRATPSTIETCRRYTD